MSNEYFNHVTRLVRQTLARADVVNALFDAIATGFDRLPPVSALRSGSTTYAADTGTANGIVLTIAGINEMSTGLSVIFKKALVNTGPTTINLNGFGPIAFRAADGSEFAANDLPAGAIFPATYDGTIWRSPMADTESGRAAAALSAAQAAASAAAASSSASTSSVASAAAVAAKAGFDGTWFGPLDTAPDDANIGSLYLNTSDLPNTVYVLTETGWNPVVTISVGGTRAANFTGVTGTGPFTVPGGYTTGDVYKNGALLTEGTDWTANVGAGTFTVAVSLISSDKVSFRGHLANDLIDIYTKAEADDIFLDISNVATARATLSVSSTAEMTAAIAAALNDYYTKTAADARFLNITNVATARTTLQVMSTSEVAAALAGYYTEAEADARFLNITSISAARTTLQVSSTSEMTAAITAAVLAATPIGKIEWFPFSTAPTGFLKANGAAVLIASYSALATAIYCGNGANATADWGYKCTNPANPTGTRSTSGTYIVLPDLRGRWPRGFDDGAGLDSGRSLWAYQSDQNKAHTHTGTTSTDGNHTHEIEFDQEGTQSGGTNRVKDIRNGGTSDYTSGASGNHDHDLNIDSQGGSEVRVLNMALLACIKFQ